MIIFRADGNRHIGSGHVMRCLSIADAFRRAGEESLFVMAEDAMKDVVESRGHQVKLLGGSYDQTEKELPIFLSLLDALKPKLIVVDSYYVTERYFLTLSETNLPIWYIDDYGKTAFSVRGILNYNAYGPDIDYRGLYEGEGLCVPRLLLGPTYAPLRDVYRDVPKRMVAKECKNVLISTGGSDPLSVAKRLVDYLQSNPAEDGLCFHFLVTPLNRDREYLFQLPVDPSRIVIHDRLNCLKDIILASDLAVSAAGSTMYELCACGLPTINYILADNQIPGCQAFARLGYMDSCGDLRGHEEQIGGLIYTAVLKLSKNYEERKRMAEAMQSYVDGLGADRVVTELIKCF